MFITILREGITTLPRKIASRKNYHPPKNFKKNFLSKDKNRETDVQTDRYTDRGTNEQTKSTFANIYIRVKMKE